MESTWQEFETKLQKLQLRLQTIENDCDKEPGLCTCVGMHTFPRIIFYLKLDYNEEFPN